MQTDAKTLPKKRKTKNPPSSKKVKNSTASSKKRVKFPEDFDLFACYSDKYDTTVKKLKETLETYGVAVLPSILDEKECQQMLDGMWDYLETVSQNFKTPIKRDRQETWKEMRHLFPLHSMLLKQFGIGQCQMIWDLRQNSKVVAPFAKLWNSEPKDLICSFDGASFHMPPEVTGKGWTNTRSPFWWHTDQSYTRNDFECAQGWVTANSVEIGDGTLAVLEGSHLYHKEFAQEFKITNKADWFKLEPSQVEWYQKVKGCPIKLISCPKGSMAFWDSRTIHCGFQALKGRKQSNIRTVGYICMLPRQLSTPTNIKKRIKAFETLRTTSHWPNKPRMNPTKPRTYGAPIEEKINDIPPPKLTSLGKRLVGY